jgi:hypothetical protein
MRDIKMSETDTPKYWQARSKTDEEIFALFGDLWQQEAADWQSSTLRHISTKAMQRSMHDGYYLRNYDNHIKFLQYRPEIKMLEDNPELRFKKNLPELEKTPLIQSGADQ